MSLDDKISKGNCVLKFEATWCGPCKEISGFVLDLGTKYSIPIISIDADMYPNYCQSFNVTKLPTLIFLNNNKEKKVVIGTDKDKILAEFTKLKINMNQNLESEDQLLTVPTHTNAQVKR